jgi:shikimate kinase
VAIEELYRARHPLYKKAANARVAISHQNELNHNANEVLKIFSEMI